MTRLVDEEVDDDVRLAEGDRDDDLPPPGARRLDELDSEEEVVLVADEVEVIPPGWPPPTPVSDRFAPIRLSAMMAVTAFCHLLLTTYFFSFVLLSLVVLPFLAGVLASHLCCKHSLGFNRRFGSLMSSFEIKSLASDEMGSKASSSKSYMALVTFVMVSKSVLPRKGDKPERST